MFSDLPYYSACTRDTSAAGILADDTAVLLVVLSAADHCETNATKIR